MSVASKTMTAPASPSRLGVLWTSSVGKKALMALTGILLSLFVLGHLLGNLQLYAGSETLNRYADFLQKSKGLLWGTRIVLLVAVGVHAVAGIQLYLGRGTARPVPYHQKENVNSTVSSRTMIWTGVLILLFVVYHLLHFTTGTVHPAFVQGDVYRNVIVGFRQGGAAVAYLVAMVALGLHLRHGLYSIFQSLGAGNPALIRRVASLAAVVATLIALANISFPLAVLAGLVRN